MVRPRRLRRAYDRVSATGEEEDDNVTAEVFQDEVEDDNDNDDDVEAGRRGRRQQYETISSMEEDRTTTDNGAEDTNKATEEEDEEEDGTKVTIVILDPAQKKFFIPAYTHWTIAQFKEKGEKVHKVPPPSQRLIYRGGLLQDNKTLEESKLVTDKLIVHLFPKPRVIIQQHSTASCSAAGEEEEDEEANSSGAHIPQIVLNPDEAEQRAHILVLGSADFLEAQNNVKLFSFLLLVISSIELFNLLLILMGVPPDNNNNTGGTNGNGAYNSEDDFFSHHDDAYFGNNTFYNNDNNNPYNHNQFQEDPYQQEQIQHELQTWHPRNNIDMIISAVGVYVALLGIRATNETTLRLAQQYLVGTVFVGIAWMMFNYWFTVHVDEEFDELRREERHNQTHGNRTTDDDAPDPIYDDDAIPYKTEFQYYQQNLSLMMIPAMVWVLCCVRAWQFQSLLQEAEREAEERIRNELAQHTLESNNGRQDNDDDDGATDASGGSDIELQTQNSNSTHRASSSSAVMA